MNQGFSILELLITLGLGVTLASVTVLQLSPMLRQSIVRSDAIAVAALVESTRIKAINTANRCEAILGLQRFSVRCSENRPSAYNYEHTFHAGVQACKPKSFFMWERGTGKGETLCLESHKKSCQVVISLRGRTSIKCL